MDRVERLRGHLVPANPDDARLMRSACSGGEGAGSLAGKCAIVTGAASGIGRATALEMAARGAKVVCSDINEEDVQETAAEINDEHPGCAVAVRADVSSAKDTQALVQACKDAFGKVDVYFANAGILPKLVPIKDEDEEQFMRTMAVNTLSVFLAIKHAGEAMKEHGEGGSIVCTASIAAMRSDLTPLQYAASKGAVLAMIKSANDRLLLDNVRVNAVVPGGVMTPIVMGVAQGLEEQGLILQGYDMARFPPIDPSEIAAIVCFLASDDSKAIKGQAVIADGGSAFAWRLLGACLRLLAFACVCWVQREIERERRTVQLTLRHNFNRSVQLHGVAAIPGAEEEEEENLTLRLYFVDHLLFLYRVLARVHAEHALHDAERPQLLGHSVETRIVHLDAQQRLQSVPACAPRPGMPVHRASRARLGHPLAGALALHGRVHKEFGEHGGHGGAAVDEEHRLSARRGLRPPVLRLEAHELTTEE